jgi:hypothetical protein
MDNKNDETESLADRVYGHAIKLMVSEKKSADQTKAALVEQGLDAESAALVVDNIQKEIEKAKALRAQKDMLYGGFMLAGGILATLADIGYFFVGLIGVGFVLVIKGVFRL